LDFGGLDAEKFYSGLLEEFAEYMRYVKSPG
jgi:hypothetical protein